MMWQRRLWPVTLMCAGLLALGACTDNDTGKGNPATEDPDGTSDKDRDKDEDKTKDDDKDSSRGGFLTTCEEDKDCDSGLCIDNLKDEKVCSVRCEEHSDCDDPDYRCSVYDSQGNDVVRACLPLPPTYCSSCERNGQPDDSVCQGYGSRCVDTGEDGFHCGRDCSAGDEVCPPESECLEFFLDDETVYQCVPKGGRICSDCVDRDGDGYGIAGDNCPYEGFDCDDTNPEINPGAQERCDDIDWDCDGDPHNGFDLTSDPNHCGGCEISCHRENMEGVCHDNECGFGACDDKYYNLDGNWHTGCEYHCPDEDFSVDDVPDDLGADTNCDGIDGDVERSVFVSTRGDDENDGTQYSPVKSIQAAIALAQDLERDHVLIEQGNYVHNDGSLHLPDGISLFGGYKNDFSTRDVYSESTHIRPMAQPAMVVEALTTETRISAVTIHARDASKEESSIAVYVEDAGEEFLAFDNAFLRAGKGGDGQNGQAGTNGRSGTVGAAGSGTDGGNGGASECAPPGGDGGSSTDCDGSGSSSGSPAQDGGGAGEKGSNYCPTCSLAWDDPNYGGDGGDGEDGVHGTSGSATNAPSDSDNAWNNMSYVGGSSFDGQSGTDGTSGGGGGSGGASRPPAGGCIRSAGGGGGGGGGGAGCGGTGGKAATAGGGSFALVLAKGTPIFRLSFLYTSDGGNGGNGGDGGDGGQGGTGGAGILHPKRPSDKSQPAPGSGGRGGDAGHGGAGSGASGACGGPSVAIALLGNASLSSEQDPDELIFTVGDGGSKGTGGRGGEIGNTGNYAPDGPDGCEGLSAETHSY